MTRLLLLLLLVVGSSACAAPARIPPRSPAPAVIEVAPPPADAMAVAVQPVTTDGTALALPLASAEGEATYYADLFTGRATASGIVFDNAEPYAAHREYPFGTVVRVTNLDNARQVDVVVVDRGPHGDSERQRRTIIDVSRSVAEQLGFVAAGRARVRVDVLVWGS